MPPRWELGHKSDYFAQNLSLPLGLFNPSSASTDDLEDFGEGLKPAHPQRLWSQDGAEARLERCLLPGSLRRPRVNSLPAYAVKVHPFSPMRPFTSEERKFRLRALPLLYHTRQTVLSYWEDYEYLFPPFFFFPPPFSGKRQMWPRHQSRQRSLK